MALDRHDDHAALEFAGAFGKSGEPNFRQLKPDCGLAQAICTL
jgi:hypothetical protein